MADAEQVETPAKEQKKVNFGKVWLLFVSWTIAAWLILFLLTGILKEFFGMTMAIAEARGYSYAIANLLGALAGLLTVSIIPGTVLYSLWFLFSGRKKRLKEV